MTSEQLPRHPPAHRYWLHRQEFDLLRFGRRIVRDDHMAHWLAGDGRPDRTKPAHTYLTARAAYVYTLAGLRGVPGSTSIAIRLLTGLTTTARDPRFGGWVDTIDQNVDPNQADKQTYTHAFVILAAATGTIAGLTGADDLLRDALQITGERFGDPGGVLFVDSVSADFGQTRPYRGINANMHMVEALLAAADATEDSSLAERAAAICSFVADQAATHAWRIPEHYDAAWRPQLGYNRDRPDDQFRPYGATVGHAFEWARLMVQAVPASSDADRLSYTAAQLVDRAVADGWTDHGGGGFVYTTDWDGAPVVSDRLHWVSAEAVGAAAALWQTTGDERYRRWYHQLWDHIAEAFVDDQHGSWHHQLDVHNQLSTSIWAGKPDLYHAYQAVLLSQLPVAYSLARAINQ